MLNRMGHRRYAGPDGLTDRAFRSLWLFTIKQVAGQLDWF